MQSCGTPSVVTRLTGTKKLTVAQNLCLNIVVS
jgi:hypothetical protein